MTDDERARVRGRVGDVGGGTMRGREEVREDGVGGGGGGGGGRVGTALKTIKVEEISPLYDASSRPK